MKAKAVNLNLAFEQETPSGTVNGTNPTFTLAYLPHSDKALLLLLNSLTLKQGVHYTISGQTITMVDPPQLGQDLFAWYFRRR